MPAITITSEELESALSKLYGLESVKRAIRIAYYGDLKISFFRKKDSLNTQIDECFRITRDLMIYGYADPDIQVEVRSPSWESILPALKKYEYSEEEECLSLLKIAHTRLNAGIYTLTAIRIAEKIAKYSQTGVNISEKIRPEYVSEAIQYVLPSAFPNEESWMEFMQANEYAHEYNNIKEEEKSS